MEDGERMINLHQVDCMEFMKDTPDNHFDLAICDPPYGIGFDGDEFEKQHEKSCDTWKKRKPKGYKNKKWDESRPNKIYFDELLRISKNQIIWGGNYFADLLPVSGGWICWDKKVVMPSASDGELAFNSCTNSLKIFTFMWAGYRKGEKCNRIHPTQKPIALYKWLLNNYAKQGDKILDTHGGSMSIAIACHDLGFDLDLCELDKDYFEAGKKRLEEHTSQLRMIYE